MLGGQQIRAYKTIMKSSRYLPRHTESAARLYRVIAGGAVIVVVVAICAIVAAKIASYGFSTDPVFLIVIPIALVLLFCWWWIDVAPTVSRWLVVLAGFAAGILCLFWAMGLQIWEQAQVAAVIVYLVAVSGTALRQISAGTDEAPNTDTT